MEDAKIKVDMPSSLHVTLSQSVYDECYCNFNETKWRSFNNFLNAGLYFPQIVQFVTVLVSILNGRISWSEIILCNLVAGTGYTIIWYVFRFYKIPGLSFISCLLGGNIFRLFIHFIPLGIISLFVLDDWTILLYCVIGGVITTIVKTILYGFLATTHYNDKVARYVSKFQY